MRRLLTGETLVAASEAPRIDRALPHGHVAATVGTLRRIGLERMLARTGSAERDLLLALIATRILMPGWKLAAARGLGDETAASSLGALLAPEDVDEDQLYAAMDWLIV